jgi:transcriptional regulator NrdR family protein
MADKRSAVVIALPLLRCPRCRGINHKVASTPEKTPDRIVRRMKCRTCKLSFTTISD